MGASELIEGFEPENDLERAVVARPEILEGLAWGEPRAGHPEGAVGRHVGDLLAAIDRCELAEQQRDALRFMALVHDTFKNQVRERLPRVGENHHAMRARRFAERFLQEERVLAAIELHDRPYALWRKMMRRGKLDERGFRRMMRRIEDPELFLRFIEIDGSTEGKRSDPIDWFREELISRGFLDERTAEACRAAAARA